MNAKTRTYWSKFYLDNFGIVADFTNVPLPTLRPGQNHFFIASDLTCEMIIEAMSKYCGVLVMNEPKDLDSPLIRNDRSSSKPYGFAAFSGIEPEIDFGNDSPIDVASQGVIGMTLLERLLFGLWFFQDYGFHPDRGYWTVCLGSHLADGQVARIFLDSSIGYYRIGWQQGNGHGHLLRTREVSIA
jgi:hypothetical protein